MASGVVDSTNAHAPETHEVAADITGDASAAAGKTFADYGVSEAIVAALADRGIITPFPIQALTLPVALGGRDIIGQAKTGTGKTLGFGIPMLEKVAGPGEEGWEQIPAKDQGAPQGLVILPTRELAQQVADELRHAAAKRSVRIVDIYGGRAYEPQEEALANGVEIVVGTPGRLLDFIGSRKLRLDQAATVVLDEADEMLDLGFLDDVEKILSHAPEVRQTMLFSATMPGAVVNMARRHMRKPTHIRAQDPEDQGATVKNTKQVVYRTHPLNKTEVIARILQARGRGRTIIFTRTKRTAARLEEELVERGFAAGSLHGDLGQGARERALRAFRSGKIDVLVATDVAARGIDVDDVTHVINYQMPDEARTYIHRIGRTGRAGHKGTAVTFVDWEDLPKWGLIDKTLNLGIPDPPETYHTSEHLYTDLDIPEGTTGKLPASQRTAAGLEAEKVEDIGETGENRQRSGARSRRGGGRRRGEARRTGGTEKKRRRRVLSRDDAAARSHGAPAASAPESPATGTHDEPRAKGTSRRGDSAPKRAKAAAGRGKAKANAVSQRGKADAKQKRIVSQQGGNAASKDTKASRRGGAASARTVNARKRGRSNQAGNPRGSRGRVVGADRTIRADRKK